MKKIDVTINQKEATAIKVFNIEEVPIDEKVKGGD